MARKLGVGVVGCGNISAAYFTLAPLFKGIEMRACADINMDAAKARAKEFKIRAETVDGLLKAKDVDIVVNLTIPAVHYEVSKQALDALFGGPAPRSAVETDTLGKAGASAVGIRSTVGDPQTKTVAKGALVKDILAAPQGDGAQARAAIPG